MANLNDVMEIAVDAGGNALLTRTINNSTSCAGGPFILGGGGGNNADVLIAKVDPNGNHVWSKAFGDTGVQVSYSVDVDGDDNMLIAGNFTGTVNFGLGPLSAGGSTDIFVAKLAADRSSLISSSPSRAPEPRRLFSRGAHAAVRQRRLTGRVASARVALMASFERGAARTSLDKLGYASHSPSTSGVSARRARCPHTPSLPSGSLLPACFPANGREGF